MMTLTCPKCGTTHNTSDMAYCWKCKAPLSESAGSTFPTGQQLAAVLQRHGIIQPEAVDDPEGYDNYETLEAVNMAARELQSMQHNDRGQARRENQ